MSKRQNPAKNFSAKEETATEIIHPPKYTLYSQRKILVALLAVLFYANTFQNQFALDDGLVYRDNTFVQQGISGIGAILSHDSYYGAMGDNENLSGGRYRPLPMIMYAIIVSVAGVKAEPAHVLNILLYALIAVVLLSFLENFVFGKDLLMALAATVLFVIHPVHTEVVANIKSLDEILSLLFLLLTLHGILLYCTKGVEKRRNYFYAVLFYFLALFSKEDGLTFIAIIPFTIYFFTEKKWKEIINLSIPFWVVAGFYVAFRFAVLGSHTNQVTQIMDNPYLNATFMQKYATILFVLVQYLKLLFFPYPLTYDYSYNQIPYHNFSDPAVIASFLIYTCLFIYAVLRWKKKDVISWCILFFLANIFIVSNIVINIGAPLTERFLFLPSIAFVVVMTEMVRRIFSSLHFSFNLQKITSIAVTGILIVICFTEVYARNKIWFNDSSLMLHDVAISKNSARANTYAGILLIRDADSTSNDSTISNDKYLQAIQYFNRSLQIDSGYYITYINQGVALSRIDSLSLAEKAWNKAEELEPGSSMLKQYDDYLATAYLNKGLEAGEKKNINEAILYLEKAVHYDPNNPSAWYNLGGAYFTAQQFAKAKSAFTQSLQLDPNQPNAQQAFTALQKMGY